MKRTLLRRVAAALLGATVLLVAARAQTSAFAVLNKELRSTQTGPALTQPLATGGFVFDAHLEGTATTPTGPIQFTLPAGGATRTLAYATDRREWMFEQAFATAAALSAAFPNGTYAYTFGGRTLSVPLTGDLFPTPPVATASAGAWSAGTLTVDHAQPLTLTIAFPQNFLAGSSRLSLTVNGAGPNQTSLTADTSGTGFSQAQLTLTIPANTLTLGRSYPVELAANRILSLDATSAPGYTVAALYSATTTFTLTVPGPPVFTQQPANLQVSNNSTAVFNASAPGATSYQWRKNNTPLPGATGPRLVLFGATSADTGSYAVTASNVGGSTPSLNANLTLAVGNDFGRLINLSILTDLTAATPSFTLGTVIGGAGTTGPKPLLVRAAGPSLAQLGVANPLADPKLAVFAGQTLVATNDDWAGTSALINAFLQVGAFAFIGSDSKDAAILSNDPPPPGGYTIQIGGPPGATGRVIAEIYDSTPATAFRAPTPRLINVSVLKRIDAGTPLTAGFVIGGSTAKTVLVRAIGPGLRDALGVQGTLADPRLDLYNSNSVRIAANDNWGGDAQLTEAGTRVGAFALPNPASADAILLLTLTPGNYTAEVSAASGGGLAIVEVYEVP